MEPNEVMEMTEMETAPTSHNETVTYGGAGRVVWSDDSDTDWWALSDDEPAPHEGGEEDAMVVASGGNCAAVAADLVAYIAAIHLPVGAI